MQEILLCFVVIWVQSIGLAMIIGGSELAKKLINWTTNQLKRPPKFIWGKINEWIVNALKFIWIKIKKVTIWIFSSLWNLIQSIWK